MYTLRCRYGGRDFDVTWDAGKLGGDPAAVLILESMAKAYAEHQVPLGPPTGPFVDTDYLKDGLATIFLARERFDVLDGSGDLPEPPEIPEGAVA